MADVLTFTPRGIYCPAGDFYIDPWEPVDRALITHGHADHARDGMGAYLATTTAAPVMRHRLGDIRLNTIDYGEVREIGDASVSYHPAGHVPGSAQIRVEVDGQVWVASGDYKTVDDGLSEPFEPVKCHAFITETTFGLPIFRWTPQDILAAREIRQVTTEVLDYFDAPRAPRILPRPTCELSHLYIWQDTGWVDFTDRAE